MSEDKVFKLAQPGTFADPLTEVLRNGAQALLAQAVEAEVAALLAEHGGQADRGRPPARGASRPPARAGDRDRDRPGRRCVSRGSATGVGQGDERIRFTLGDPAALRAPLEEPRSV